MKANGNFICTDDFRFKYCLPNWIYYPTSPKNIWEIFKLYLELYLCHFGTIYFKKKREDANRSVQHAFCCIWCLLVSRIPESRCSYATKLGVIHSLLPIPAWLVIENNYGQNQTKQVLHKCILEPKSDVLLGNLCNINKSGYRDSSGQYTLFAKLINLNRRMPYFTILSFYISLSASLSASPIAVLMSRRPEIDHFLLLNLLKHHIDNASTVMIHIILHVLGNILICSLSGRFCMLCRFIIYLFY